MYMGNETKWERESMGIFYFSFFSFFFFFGFWGFSLNGFTKRGIRIRRGTYVTYVNVSLRTCIFLLLAFWAKILA